MINRNSSAEERLDYSLIWLVESSFNSGDVFFIAGKGYGKSLDRVVPSLKKKYKDLIYIKLHGYRFYLLKRKSKGRLKMIKILISKLKEANSFRDSVLDAIKSLK